MRRAVCASLLIVMYTAICLAQDAAATVGSNCTTPATGGDEAAIGPAFLVRPATANRPNVAFLRTGRPADRAWFGNCRWAPGMARPR